MLHLKDNSSVCVAHKDAKNFARNVFMYLERRKNFPTFFISCFDKPPVQIFVFLWYGIKKMFLDLKKNCIIISRLVKVKNPNRYAFVFLFWNISYFIKHTNKPLNCFVVENMKQKNNNNSIDLVFESLRSLRHILKCFLKFDVILIWRKNAESFCLIWIIYIFKR